MEISKANEMGMPLDKWEHESCTPLFGIGDTWATLYSIGSDEKKKGHATELLKEAKVHYEKLGLKFGGSVALNDGMRRIYKKLEITEYC